MNNRVVVLSTMRGKTCNAIARATLQAVAVDMLECEGSEALRLRETVLLNMASLL
jgi:hypothetical protein